MGKDIKAMTVDHCNSKYIVFMCNQNSGVVFHLSPAGLDHAEAICGDDEEKSLNNWVPSIFDGPRPKICKNCKRIRLMERLAE